MLKKIPGWEEHLVARAQGGEAVAFELLVDMHRPSVFANALRMLRDVEDAHDATQDTFLKACKALHSFESGRPMLPWLLRICTNCCVDLIRSRRAYVENIDDHEYSLADDRVDVGEGVESSIGMDSLFDAIGRLPGRYREIVLMRHCRHMDVNQIAAELGKPEGTIKSWLFRARALLRKDLGMAMG